MTSASSWESPFWRTNSGGNGGVDVRRKGGGWSQLRLHLTARGRSPDIQAADQPPSEVTKAPLTLDASSLASQEITEARASGWAGGGMVAILS